MQKPDDVARGTLTIRARAKSDLRALQEHCLSGTEETKKMRVSKHNLAYGGVVVDADGRILVRQPTALFNGYVWTFPYGPPEPWETPEEAALREVKAETGYTAEIRRKLPGSFRSSTSITKFFLMSPVGPPIDFNSQGTSAIKWATIEEAAKLIRMTTNNWGKARDLSVLVAVHLALKDQQD